MRFGIAIPCGRNQVRADLVLCPFSMTPSGHAGRSPATFAARGSISGPGLLVRRLRPWWLSIRCNCGASSFLPLRMMASGPLAGSSIADVLVALRCQRCHEAPATVMLVEDPASDAPGRMGSPPGWKVALVSPANGRCRGTAFAAILTRCAAAHPALHVARGTRVSQRVRPAAQAAAALQSSAH